MKEAVKLKKNDHLNVEKEVKEVKEEKLDDTLKEDNRIIT